MEKFKGTPGPWEAGVKDGENKFVYCDDALGSAICQVDLSHTLLPKSQIKANTHLIAAAPELLQALQNLVEWDHGTVNRVQAYKDAQSAINKALNIEIK